MIHNPQIPKYYRYDPYTKSLTIETYDLTKMHDMRLEAVKKARAATTFGLILGTLGRQGNPLIMKHLEKVLEAAKKEYMIVLLSEITPARLKLFPQIDAWIQIACPRLSIDWGTAFEKPVLTPYEAEVCLGTTPWQAIYPMDYYAADGGEWSNGAYSVRIQRKPKISSAVRESVAAPERKEQQVSTGEGNEARK